MYCIYDIKKTLILLLKSTNLILSPCFCTAASSSRNALPPGLCMAGSHSSSKSPLKCHLLKEVLYHST